MRDDKKKSILLIIKETYSPRKEREMGNELMDSVVTAYHATVTAPIDAVVIMYATVVFGLVIAGYNIIAGISIEGSRRK